MVAGHRTDNRYEHSITLLPIGEGLHWHDPFGNADTGGQSGGYREDRMA